MCKLATTSLLFNEKFREPPMRQFRRVIIKAFVLRDIRAIFGSGELYMKTFFVTYSLIFSSKNSSGMMIRNAAIVLLLLATTVLGTGCKEDPPVNVDRERSFLHILGGAAVDTFDITFDYYNADNVVISNFYYMRNFPIQGYADLQATRPEDEFGNGKNWMTAHRQPFANVAPDTVLGPEELFLAPNEQATLCFADSLGKLVTLKISDNISFPNDTSAMVRFINLAPETSMAGLSTADGSLNNLGVGFLQYTDFLPVNPGARTVEVRDSSNAIVSSAGYWLNGRKAYTFYLSGNGSGILDYFVH